MVIVVAVYMFNLVSTLLPPRSLCAFQNINFNTLFVVIVDSEEVMSWKRHKKQHCLKMPGFRAAKPFSLGAGGWFPAVSVFTCAR